MNVMYVRKLLIDLDVERVIRLMLSESSSEVYSGNACNSLIE
jgi:hypothetical protein